MHLCTRERANADASRLDRRTSTVHYAHHVLLQRPVVVKAYDRKKLSPRHSLYIEREIETLQLLRSNR